MRAPTLSTPTARSLASLGKGVPRHVYHYSHSLSAVSAAFLRIHRHSVAAFINVPHVRATAVRRLGRALEHRTARERRRGARWRERPLARRDQAAAGPIRQGLLAALEASELLILSKEADEAVAHLDGGFVAAEEAAEEAAESAVKGGVGR